MVNRYGTFNRRKVNRMKVIRDKKRARINRKKKAIGYTDGEEEKLTKKEERKLKRTENILKAAGIEDVSKIHTKKRIKRRNKKKEKKEKEAMEVDDE